MRAMLFLLCWTSACAGTSQATVNSGATAAEVEPIEASEFYSDDNLAHYIETVDSLLRKANANPFAGIRALQAGRTTKLVTTNGMHIVMSVTNTETVSVHHVSLSHPVYLATPFARFILGLVATRGAYPSPGAVLHSQNGVYHVEWQVPNDARESLVQARAEAMQVTDPHEVARLALLAMQDTQFKSIQVPQR